MALLLAFGVAFTFSFTGLTIHEWFGLTFGLALLIHMHMAVGAVLIMAHGLLPLRDAMSFAAALHSVGSADGGRSLLDAVFGAAAFDFTDGTHLRRIRMQVQVARRLGLLLQM